MFGGFVIAHVDGPGEAVNHLLFPAAQLFGCCCNLLGQGSGPGFKATAFDIAAQEDARRLTWTAPASLQLRWDAQELPQTAALKMRVSVANAPLAAITLKALGEKAKASLDLTPTMKLVEGKGMRDIEVPLACISDGAIAGIELASAGAFVFELETISVVPQAAQMDCTGPF